MTDKIEVPSWLDGFEQDARKHAGSDPFHHDALRLVALIREAAQPAFDRPHETSNMQEFVTGFRPADEEAAQPGPAEQVDELDLRFILQIYDDAMQKAFDGRKFDNPCKPGSLAAMAWEIGAKEGTNKREAGLPNSIARPADEELRRDAERLDFMDRHHFELDSSGAWKEEPKFGLHEVTGGRNDREWRCVSRGETIRAVIDAAIAAEKREAKHTDNDGTPLPP